MIDNGVNFENKKKRISEHDHDQFPFITLFCLKFLIGGSQQSLAQLGSAHSTGIIGCKRIYISQML